MNETLSMYTWEMQQLLLQQERIYGSLTSFLSRKSREDSRLINEVINAIITHMIERSSIKWCNIKIFGKDTNCLTKYRITISAECYNYLLMNTNFNSGYNFKNDMRFTSKVNIWPTLSPYLFLQIIWKLKCEDLLIESLVHIPLHLCAEILEIIVNNIPRLHASRTRRFIFLLIYKVYYKFLWLHLDRLSMSDVMIRVNQLVAYFKMLCKLLVLSKFVIFDNLSAKPKYVQHGILVKNIVRYIKKCMYSKIESYSENHNLAELFRLTYNFSDKDYYYNLPGNMMKPIIWMLENELADLLLNQIKDIDLHEFVTWGHTDDDENITISLQGAIIMECNDFLRFMNQNQFLETTQDMSYCLEQLRRCIVDRRNSNESTVTLSEICQNIFFGEKWYYLKELMKRYKEWDLFILNFIKNRIEYLTVPECFVILEYLHYIFRRLHNKVEKYKYYILVLKILIQLSVIDLQIIVKNYVECHFDDNPLEFLYNEDCFTAFIETFESDNHDVVIRLRILLIFILLNPRKVLTKLVVYEISEEFESNILFRNMSAIREIYSLNKNRYNILVHILKDIIFQQHIKLGLRFTTFIEDAATNQMISALNIINDLYVAYLVNNTYNEGNVTCILIHLNSIFETNALQFKSVNTLLLSALIKTASVLRRLRMSCSKFSISDRISLINIMLSDWNIHTTKEDTHTRILFYTIYSTESLEMPRIWRESHIKIIIQDYKFRCFGIIQYLRRNPQRYPKLRDFTRSFILDHEAFLRHIILHCTVLEYEAYTYDLTFKYLYNYGWADNMIAYENIMRISADALQITLIHADKFPKDMFLTCLIAIANYSKLVESNMLDNYKPIRRILLKTLSSLNPINKTASSIVYRKFLKEVQEMDLNLPRTIYCNNIIIWTYHFRRDMLPLPMSKWFYKRSSLIHEKIATMYNAYLFIHESIKSSFVIHLYPQRIIHKLCQIIPDDADNTGNTT